MEDIGAACNGVCPAIVFHKVCSDERDGRKEGIGNIAVFQHFADGVLFAGGTNGRADFVAGIEQGYDAVDTKETGAASHEDKGFGR